MPADHSRARPSLEVLEERIHLDASVVITAGTTIMIDVNNDGSMDHAIQVTDGNVELHYAVTGSYNSTTKELTLIGGIQDLNALIITNSGTNGADFQTSYTEVESVQIGTSQSVENADIGVTTGGKAADTSGGVRSVTGLGGLKNLNTSGDLDSVNLASLTGKITVGKLAKTGANTGVDLSITEGSNSFSFGASQGGSVISLDYKAGSDELTIQSDSGVLNNYTITDAGDQVDSLVLKSGGITSVNQIQVNGDLDGFKSLDSLYVGLRVTGAQGPLIIDNETNTVTIDPSASLDLTYTPLTDRLDVNSFQAGQTLSITDANNFVDSIVVASGTGAMGDITVTGDLDSFTAADDDYATLRITAVNGPIVIGDGSNSVTINPSAVLDLGYTGSTDSLLVHDFVNGATLTISDAQSLVDSLSVDSQVGKSLGTLLVTGDLDAFTAADGDYSSLQVTAADGALVLGDGVNSSTVTTSAATNLSYTGSSDSLSVNAFVAGSTLAITDAQSLVDSLSVASGTGSLSSITVTGDLGSFTAATGDYDGLQVTAVNGSILVSDGSQSFTVTTSADTNLLYNPVAQSLQVVAFTNGATVSISDTSNMVDSLSVQSGAGSLGAITVTGDLDSFTAADGDFASLRLSAVNGPLVISDGTNSMTVNLTGTTDLSYVGTTDSLSILDYTDAATLSVTDSQGLLDNLTVSAQGGKSLGAVTVTGDLDSFTAAETDYVSLNVTAASGALLVDNGSQSFTVDFSAASSLSYAHASDTLVVQDFTDGSTLVITDASGLVDSLTVTNQVGKSLGAVTVTGDLDAFTAQDGDYTSLRVTAANGLLTINDGSNSFTVDPSASADLRYTGSSDTLAVLDYQDASSLGIVDANAMVDALTVGARGGKSLGAITMTGDLDSFTAADGDYASLRVSAVSGPIAISDGINSMTVNLTGSTDLSYVGTTDTLSILDYTDAATLNVTDAQGLLDSLTVSAQGGKSLGAVTVTGDLDAFTSSESDYVSLRVTAAAGSLLVDNGSQSFTVNASAGTDLSYTHASDSLVIQDYTNGAGISVTDANALVDSITVSAQGGKSLGAITMTGDLDSFTAADGDYASLRVSAVSGPLAVSDGTNSMTVSLTGSTDLSYVGTTDSLSILDYTDAATLNVTDGQGLLDNLTVSAQGGKSLGAITVTGDLDSFAAADGDYASLRVSAVSGPLAISDGTNSMTVSLTGSTDLSYIGTTDTLSILDYTDAATLSVTDAQGILDSLVVSAQGGKSLGSVMVTGDLDAFTSSESDYVSLRVTAVVGSLLVDNGIQNFTVNSSAATDLSYTHASDTLLIQDYANGAAVSVTDANALVDSITVSAQGGKSLGAITMTGDLDSFTGADGDYASLRVSAVSGPLVISDGSNSMTVNLTGSTDLSYVGTTDSLSILDYTDAATLNVTDGQGLLDNLTVSAQGGKSLGAVTVTGDLDSYTAAETDYVTLNVTAASGALLIDNGSQSFTVDFSAASSLSYAHASDALVVQDFTDGSTLIVTDANGLVDSLTVTNQVGKSLGTVTVMGDLDSFTAADGDYASIRVSAVSGPLVISDGTNSMTVSLTGTTDLSYVGTTDSLSILDYTDAATLSVTDGQGLLDSLTVLAQSGKTLGAVTVTGDLDTFTSSETDYASLRVTAVVGNLLVDNGSQSFTVNAGASTDLSYTHVSDSLLIQDYTNGTSVSVSDANALVDSITVNAQGGKSLGVITMTGDLDSFTAADSDYASLRVSAVSGPLVISDASNSMTVSLTGTTDLSYDGTTDSLSILDYSDAATLSVTDSQGLLDNLIVSAQGGKSLGAVTVSGDLDQFRSAESDYVSLRVTGAIGPLLIDHGSQSLTIDASLATDLRYTHATDTLLVLDYSDSGSITISDASNQVDSISITAQSGKSMDAIVVMGDLDAFTGADGDYASLRVSAAQGPLLLNDGSSTVTVDSSLPMDLSYFGSNDKLVVADYAEGGLLTIADAQNLVDEIEIQTGSGKRLGQVLVQGDLDRFVALDSGSFSTVEVTAATGQGSNGLRIDDGGDVILAELDKGSFRIRYSSSSLVGPGGEAQVFSTSGTDLTSNLRLQDIGDSNLFIREIRSLGSLASIQSNGTLQDLWMTQDLRSLSLGQFTGTLHFENQGLGGGQGPLLDFTLGSNSFKIDLSRADSVIGYELTARSQGLLDMRVFANSTDSNRLLIEDPDAQLRVLEFVTGLRPVFENTTITGPNALGVIIYREEFGGQIYDGPDDIGVSRPMSTESVAPYIESERAVLEDPSLAQISSDPVPEVLGGVDAVEAAVSLESEAAAAVQVDEAPAQAVAAEDEDPISMQERPESWREELLAPESDPRVD